MLPTIGTTPATFTTPIAESIRAMNNVTASMLSSEEANLIGGYFNYLIAAMY
jgi:hypothetical protein